MMEEINASITPVSFIDMINQVTLNLKVIGDIKNTDKISTIHEFIEIDSYKYFRGISRKWYGDSRNKTLNKIEQVISDTICVSDQLLTLEPFSNTLTNLPDVNTNARILQDLIPNMTNAIKGLHNLKLTYKDDVLTENKLDMSIKKINDQVDKIKNSMKIH